jgi:predicted PurR-regulated permease PerM
VPETARIGYGEFLRYALVFVGVATLPVLIWYLFDAVLIAVGAVILATLLRLVAEPFMRWLSLPQALALTLAGLVIVVAIAGAGFLFGTRVSGEMHEVIQRAGSAEQMIRSSIEKSGIGQTLVQAGGSGVTGFLTRFLALGTEFVAGIVVLLISGIYLAAQPQVYRQGLVQLFPPRLHHRIGETLDDMAVGLRLWLIGQLIQMLLVAVLSALAAWLIGLPAALALGLIAGLAEFIPYLGPIIAAVPAVLVAFTKSFDAVLWTVLAYIIIHQTEGNLIVPLVQRRLVFIPPALMLLAIVAISFLFGGMATVFAAPITVLLFIAVKKIYVRDTLGERTDIPGRPARP